MKKIPRIEISAAHTKYILSQSWILRKSSQLFALKKEDDIKEFFAENPDFVQSIVNLAMSDEIKVIDQD